MRNWLNTYCRIDGGKFLIVYLMLLGSPFWFCALPLLILVAPLRLIWQKPNNREAWRSGSLSLLLISLMAGAYCAFGVSYMKDSAMYYGFPMGISNGGMRQPDEMDWYYYGWVPAMNISLVVGVLMLPLTIASYVETRRRLARGK